MGAAVGGAQEHPAHYPEPLRSSPAAQSRCFEFKDIHHQNSNNRHSSESSLLSRESLCTSCKHGKNVRHPSESWDPATYKASKALDDSLRSPLRGHPSDVLRAARYVQLSLG